MECSFADAQLWSAPGQVGGLLLARTGPATVELRWSSQDAASGQATVYDVVSGSLQDLRQDGGFGRAGCLVDDHDDTPYAAAIGEPQAGQGTYYLVRGHNRCGAADYGSGSPPGPRVALDSEVPCSLL